MSEHSGHWAIAIIVIVLISWGFYRFVAPKNWREWTRAGLVQAFIISLYAEMYGFPVTIYFLSRFIGLDISSANLWSDLLGPKYGETGMMVGMLFGYGFVILGIWLLVEGWREVYKASRENRLATEGVYKIVRHPQYVGIILALFGEGIVHWPTILSVILFPIITVAYIMLAKKEDKELLKKFGTAYQQYAKVTPAFIPHWTSL